MKGQLLLILGMALVTYIPRVLPLWFLSSKNPHPAFMRWLEMIPPAVLAALLAPALFLAKDAAGNDAFFFSLRNLYLLAAIPAFLTAFITKSFLGTVAAGMGCLALFRLVL